MSCDVAQRGALGGLELGCELGRPISRGMEAGEKEEPISTVFFGAAGLGLGCFLFSAPGRQLVHRLLCHLECRRRCCGGEIGNNVGGGGCRGIRECCCCRRSNAMADTGAEPPSSTYSRHAFCALTRACFASPGERLARVPDSRRPNGGTDRAGRSLPQGRHGGRGFCPGAPID